MARFMIGTDGFEYKYVVGKSAIDLSLLARAAGVGALLFTVEYLVSFKDGHVEGIPWADLKQKAALDDAAAGPGRYESSSSEDPQNAFEVACAAEQERVPPVLRVVAQRAQVAGQRRRRGARAHRAQGEGAVPDPT